MWLHVHVLVTSVLVHPFLCLFTIHDSFSVSHLFRYFIHFLLFAVLFLLYFGYWFYVHYIYCKCFLFEIVLYIILYILSLLNSNLDFFKMFFWNIVDLQCCVSNLVFISVKHISISSPFGLCLFKKSFIFLRL